MPSDQTDGGGAMIDQTRLGEGGGHGVAEQETGKFGGLLLERGPRTATWVLGLIMGELLYFAFLSVSVMNIVGGPKGTGKNIPVSFIIGVCAIGGMVHLAVLAAQKLGTKVRFCERGTVMMRFGRVRSAIPHGAVEAIRLMVT